MPHKLNHEVRGWTHDRFGNSMDDTQTSAFGDCSSFTGYEDGVYICKVYLYKFYVYRIYICEIHYYVCLEAPFSLNFEWTSNYTRKISSLVFELNILGFK